MIKGVFIIGALAEATQYRAIEKLRIGSCTVAEIISYEKKNIRATFTRSKAMLRDENALIFAIYLVYICNFCTKKVRLVRYDTIAQIIR